MVTKDEGNDAILVPRSWGARSRYEGVTLFVAMASLMFSGISILVGTVSTFWIFSQTDYESRRSSCLQALSAELAEGERLEVQRNTGFTGGKPYPSSDISIDESQRLAAAVDTYCVSPDLLPEGWGMRTALDNTWLPGDNEGGPPPCQLEPDACPLGVDPRTLSAGTYLEVYSDSFFRQLDAFIRAREAAYLYVTAESRPLLPWQSAAAPTWSTDGLPDANNP